MADIKRIFMRQEVQTLFLMGIRGTSLVSKFLLTLFIARFMGFEALGLYGLIAAASIIVPVFFGLGLMYTVSRRAVMQSQLEIVQHLKHYWVYTAIIYIVIIAGVASVGVVLDKLFLVLVIAIVIFLEHLNNDLYGLLLNLSKSILANILHFVRTALWMLIFIGGSFFFPEYRTMEYLLLGWACGGALSLLGFFWIARGWPWFDRMSGITIKQWISEEFKQSRILYLDSFVNTVGTYMNHYIVTFFLGLELTGVYVFFAQIMAALSNLVETGVIQLARPKMVRAFKMQDSAYNSIHLNCLKYTAFTAIAMSVLAGGLIYPVTALVDRPAIVEWFPIFWILLIGFVVSMYRRANDLVFYSQHRDDLTLKINLIFVALGATSSVVFIYLFGFWGVAFGVFIVSPTILIIQHLMIKKLKMKSEGQ